MISLRQISFSYNDNFNLYADFIVECGEFVVVFGPNGSGKSSLLNLIAGFLPVQNGTILISGKDITRYPPSKRGLSMLFQKNNLFTHLSVFKNIALGISSNLKVSKEQVKDIESILDRLDLLSCRDELPLSLSGGQVQKVALARSLIQEKPLLLLDEPFSSLEPRIRHDLIKLVYQLSKEKFLTTLLVTHNPLEVKEQAETVIFMEEGKVSYYGSGQTFYESKNSSIALYLDRQNV